MGFGDRLAAGGTKAAFPASEKVTQDKWDSIFNSFDPQEYNRKADAEQTERERLREEQIGS